MAGIAFVATHDQEPTEREVTPRPRRAPTRPRARAEPRRRPAKPKRTEAARSKRGEVYVEVYNNSGITGLAGARRRQGHQVRAGRSWAPTTGTAPSRPHRLLPAAAQGRGQAAGHGPRHRADRARRRPDAAATGSRSSSPPTPPEPAAADRLARPRGAGWRCAMEFTLARRREQPVRRAGRDRRVDRVVVGLDFDGTLVADRRRPRGRRTSTREAPRGPGRPRRAWCAAVAVITGRPARQALALGGLDEVGNADRRPRRASCSVFGQYGNERWSSTDRRVVSPRPPHGPRVLRARAARGCCAGPSAADAYVEEKGLAVAVHTRRLADPAAALERLLPLLARAGRRARPGASSRAGR